MQGWAHNKTLKNLCGFLGLARYYKKFMKNYGKKKFPLTSLLKNNAFVWNETTKQDFSA